MVSIKAYKTCNNFRLNHVHHPGAKDKGTLADRFPIIRDGKALCAGTDGISIWPDISPQNGDIVIEKIRQSGFMYTRLDATLKELKVINLLIAGVSTGACVESTARDACFTRLFCTYFK